jgi:hypothetical protein
MVDIKTIIPVVVKKIEKCGVGGIVDLKTYKRDRGVTVIKLAEDQIKIVEDGFEKDEFIIPAAKLKKTLKSLIKKEFPRSNKVRLAVKSD